MGKLHQQMLEVLGIQDAGDIIKLPEDIKPMDPVAENMALLQQTPVKAFLYQDHEAHIAAHMAAMQDPKIAQMVGQSPFAGAIQAAAMSHITEHLAYQYRKEIETTLGVPLPPEGEPLPEDVEVQLSRAVAQAAGKLFNRNMAEQQAQQAQQQAQDPLTIIQMKEIELKERELDHKIDIDNKKLQVSAANQAGNLYIQQERVESENDRAAATTMAKLATDAVRENDKAQMIETRRYQRTVIAGAFGVPPTYVGDLERATFNNVEQQTIGFTSDVIYPVVQRFEAALERDLLTEEDWRGGVVIRFNLDSILRADFKSRQEGLQIQRTNGVLSADEWREIEGKNPLPAGKGGDEYLYPANMMIAGKAPDEPEDAPEETDDGTEADPATDQEPE
jgi:hypothetical protein